MFNSPQEPHIFVIEAGNQFVYRVRYASSRCKHYRFVLIVDTSFFDSFNTVKIHSEDFASSIVTAPFAFDYRFNGTAHFLYQIQFLSVLAMGLKLGQFTTGTNFPILRFECWWSDSSLKF